MGDSADSPHSDDQSDDAAEQAAAGSDHPTDQSNERAASGKRAESDNPPESTEPAETAADPGRAWSRVDRIVAGMAILWAGGLVALVVLDNGPPEPGDTPMEAATVVAPPREDSPTPAEVVEALEVSTGFTSGEVIACAHPAGDETGFYPGADLCPEEEHEVIGGSVSYGIVIENTSDHVVRDVTVSYRFLDADDEPIAARETMFSIGDPIYHDSRIPQLEPGQSVGLSDTRHLQHSDVATLDVEIDDDIETTPADYYENYERPQGFRWHGLDMSAVDVTDIDVGYGDPGGEPVVTFMIESHRDTAAEVGWATVIFRDTSGEILGGVAGTPDPDGRGVTVPPEGTVEGEMAVEDPMEIPDIDPDRTEVHLFAYHP